MECLAAVYQQGGEGSVSKKTTTTTMVYDLEWYDAKWRKVESNSGGLSCKWENLVGTLIWRFGESSEHRQI